MFRQTSFSGNSASKRNLSAVESDYVDSAKKGSVKNLSLTQSFSKNRTASFEGNSFASEDIPVVDESNLTNVYLKASGKFLNKIDTPFEGEAGLVASFWNYPTRNKQWPITYTCFNQKTGGFSIADERGQVYKMSISNNHYQSVRLASTSVSSMSFLSAQKNLLAIAYENGIIVIIDSNTKDILGNIQTRHKSTARLIRCHPTLPRLILATDDRTVSLWDFSSCQCLQSMDCEEAIVDVRFELGGDAIAVTLEHSGAYLYVAETCELMVHLTLPASERKPVWTAYCSTLSTNSEMEYGKIHLKKGGNPRETAPTKLLNVLLAGDNAMVYSWCVNVTEHLNEHADVAVNLTMTKNSLKKTRTPIKAHLVGVIELPIKVKMAVHMTLIGEQHQLPPRVAILTADGALLIVDIDGFREKALGYWKVVSDVPPSHLHGKAAVDVLYAPVAVGSRRHVASHDSANGKLGLGKGYLTVIGFDGAARLIDIQYIVGFGDLAGGVLRSRTPHTTSGAAGGGSGKASAGAAQSGAAAAEAQWGDEFSGGNPMDKENCSGSRRNEDFVLCHSFTDEELADAEAGGSGGNGKTSAISINKRQSTVFTSHGARSGVNKHPLRTQQPLKARLLIDEKNGNKPGSRGSSDPNSPKPLSFMATSKAMRASDHIVDPLTTPLFELAHLSPKEKQVNLQKLRTFLSINGEFPSRYRSLIWRFLLKLPENTAAFTDLVQRGVHTDYEYLHEKYPIEAKKVFTKLQNLCSQMAHWAPILGDAPYLPSLVFPFILVYGTDELAALETSMTIMMWWGYSWHVTHPNPPIHIVDSLDNLLKHHEAKVHHHLTLFGVSPGLLLWSMLSTLFTEILSRSNWFKMMDFLFCYFEDTTYFLLTPIAIMRELKFSLLGTQSAAQINSYCRSQQGVEMVTLIRNLKEMHDTTPSKYFTGVATKNLGPTRFQLGGASQIKEVVELNEVEEARENLALGSGIPMHPLPKIRYPVYDGYPESVLDLQIKERDRVLSMGREVARREGVLTMLERKLQEIEQDHQVWMQKHETASEAEMLHQKEMMEKEKAHLRELHRIEEEISLSRIKSLNALEVAAKEEMQLLDKAAEDAKKMMIESEQHMREKMHITLSLQKHRELSEQAEAATQEKIRRLRMRRAREDWVQGMATALQTKEQELSARDAIINEKWKKQDDELRQQRDLRASQSKLFEETDSLSRMQDDMIMRMQRLQMEREAKIIEIERARAVRLAKEQAEEALEAQERAALLLRRQEVLTATKQSNELSLKSAEAAEEKILQAVSQIREESARLIEDERVHAMRSSKARQAARQSQLQKEWAEKEAQQLREAVAAQGELQEHWLRVHRAGVQSEAEGAYVRASMEDVVNQAEDRESLDEKVLSHQRERFRETAQYMRNESAHRLRGQQEESRQQQMDRKASFTRKDVTSSGEFGGPTWSRDPADIPAPKSGAGIGYGVQPVSGTTRTSSTSSTSSTSRVSSTDRSSSAVASGTYASVSKTRQEELMDQELRASQERRKKQSQNLPTATEGGTASTTSTSSRRGPRPHNSSSDGEGSGGSSSGSSSTVNNQIQRHQEKKVEFHHERHTQGLMDDPLNYASSDSEELESYPLQDSIKLASKKLLNEKDDSDDDGDVEDVTHWDNPAMQYKSSSITSSNTLMPPSFSLTSATSTTTRLHSSSTSSSGARANASSAAASRYSTSASSTADTQTAGTTVRSTSSQANRGGSGSSGRSSNVDDIRRISEDALRNLNETRALNRSEKEEEEHQSKSTAYRTTTTTTYTSTSQRRSVQQEEDDINVTIDNDSALWAFQD